MAKPRVLYDLSFGIDRIGFSGIPQDTRLLFDALTESSEIDISGWIRPFGQSRYSRKSLDDLVEQAEFLGPFLSNRIDQRDFIAKILDRFRFHRASRGWQLIGQGFNIDKSLYPANNMLNDLIWRRIFASTVSPNNRNKLINQKYYLSKFGAERHTAAALRMMPVPKFRTDNFDYVITQDTRPMRVNSKTRKIVRYHDGIPVTASDTFENALPTKVHVNAIRMASKDTFFICNSTSAQNDLGNISSEAGNNSVVIPYFIPKMDRNDVNKDALLAIARSRISHSTLAQPKQKRAIERWFGKGEGIPPFIMSLATIEPRKNYLRLIEAWQLLRIRGFKELRLMIVGSPGWAFDHILNGMRPYVEQGELLHVERIAQTELPILYSAAKAFCFPSMAEGFGLPPTEAMQCGCPVILSDIAAHRYMAGEAASFCDPYSVSDIADRIQGVLEQEAYREHLIALGKENVQRFSLETLLPLWEEFFISRMGRKNGASA